jgi:copper chaperone CopZ
MYELKVENMSCGHCTARITQAVKSVDPEAGVEIDLPSRQVRIESGCELAEFADALTNAGYPVVTAVGV